MKLVVYDLDQTLMPIDTGDVWVRWLLASCGHAARQEALATLDRFAREYWAQTLSIEEFESWQMRFLAGFERTFLEQARDDYKREILAPIVPPEARAIVEDDRRAGHITAICTATYAFATQPSAELFAVDHLLAVRPEENEKGEFTGGWIAPMTYREGKVLAVENLVGDLAARGIAIEAYAFWSDSTADLPLFEYTAQRGGECHVVNAGEKLQAIGRARGWSVGRTYDVSHEAFARGVVAKALAKRENALS